MKGKIEIEYEWWRVVPSGNGKAPVFERHEEALRERAEASIARKMDAGFVCGQITDWIREAEEDGEDGVDYEGFWESTRVYGDGKCGS